MCSSHGRQNLNYDSYCLDEFQKTEIRALRLHKEIISSLCGPFEFYSSQPSSRGAALDEPIPSPPLVEEVSFKQGFRLSLLSRAVNMCVSCSLEIENTFASFEAFSVCRWRIKKDQK